MKVVKIILIILMVLAVLLAAVYYFRDLILKQVVEESIEKSLGVKVRMDRMKSFPFAGKYIAKQVTIKNPKIFSRKQLAYFPRIVLIIDNESLIRGEGVQIKLLSFKIEKMNIIQDSEKRVNLELIAHAIEKGSFFKKYVPIRLLRFSVEDVFFLDEGDKKSKVRSYPIQTGKLVYENADSLEDVLDVVIKEIISRVKLREAVNILKGTLFNNIANLTMVPADTVELAIEAPLLLLGAD